MKTKSLFYILLSILVFSFASCADDEKINYIKHDELPKEVQTFLSEYLPNNKFVSATTVDISGESHYMVQLKDEVEAVLTKDNWVTLTSEKGLPETVINLLSRESRKQFNEQHGAAKITALSNMYIDPELGIWITLDNHKTLNDMYGNEGNVLAERYQEGALALPEQLKLFLNDVMGISTRASDARPWIHIVKYSGFKGTIYRLRITRDAFVDFYENGEWFYMKESGNEGIIKNRLLRAISPEMRTALVGKEPNALASIQKITRFNNGELYGFTLAEKNFVLINSDNQVVEPPLDKAKEFIKKGFGLEDGLEYKVNSNTTAPYFLRYGFIVTGDMGKISLVTDVEGNMRNVSAGPITSEAGITVPLPRAVLEMLHGEIVSYLDEHFLQKNIIHIFHSYSKTGDKPSEVSLMMQVPHNLKTLVFDCNTGKFIKEYYTIGETN